jgi:hypothetical protein
MLPPVRVTDSDGTPLAPDNQAPGAAGRGAKSASENGKYRVVKEARTVALYEGERRLFSKDLAGWSTWAASVNYPGTAVAIVGRSGSTDRIAVLGRDGAVVRELGLPSASGTPALGPVVRVSADGRLVAFEGRGAWRFLDVETGETWAHERSVGQIEQMCNDGGYLAIRSDYVVKISVDGRLLRQYFHNVFGGGYGRTPDGELIVDPPDY